MPRQPAPTSARRRDDLDATPPRALPLTAAVVLAAVLGVGVPVVAAGAAEPADATEPAAEAGATGAAQPNPTGAEIPGLAEPAGAFMTGPNGAWWVLTAGGLYVYSPTPTGPSDAYVLVAPDPSGRGYWLTLDTVLVGSASQPNDAATTPEPEPASETDGGSAPTTATTAAPTGRPAAPATTTTTVAPRPAPTTTTAAPPASSGGPSGSTTYLGEFEVTCYSLRGTTSTGEQTHEGGVAVDPRVIPYGTRIHIEGVGWRTANDTGRKIQGNRLDIWHPSADWCRDFGRRILDVHR